MIKNIQTPQAGYRKQIGTYGNKVVAKQKKQNKDSKMQSMDSVLGVKMEIWRIL